MSRFLSPKYLRYRDAAARGTIEGDLACRHCGYNLRGLRYGQNCPECGQLNDLVRPLYDLLLSSGTEERRRWRQGLGLAANCVAIALLARIVYFILAAPGATGTLSAIYIGVGAVNSLLWIGAVWMITPDALLKRWPWMRHPRSAARVLSIMWTVGYACLIARYALNLGPAVEAWVYLADLGGRLLGGLGVMCTAFILSFVAEEAELPVAARRLNAAVWLLWFPTLLAQAFPAAIPWFGLVLLAFVLFFWGWLMALLYLGIRALNRHVVWAQRLAEEGMGREERIAHKRAEIDREVEATIRPLPERDEGDVAQP